MLDGPVGSCLNDEETLDLAETLWHPLCDGLYEVGNYAMAVIEQGSLVRVMPPEGERKFDNFADALSAAVDLHDRWYKAYNVKQLYNSVVREIRRRRGTQTLDIPEGLWLETHKTLMLDNPSPDLSLVFVQWNGNHKVADLRGYRGTPRWLAGPSAGCDIILM